MASADRPQSTAPAGRAGRRPDTEPADLAEVRILSFPMAVYLAAREHSDGLMREFQLLAIGNPEAADVPKRLGQLAERLSTDYAGFTVAAEAALADAEAAGTAELDLTYRLPHEVAGAAAELGDLLDEADRFCASGEYLLTLVTPPEALAFRRWFIDEVVRQIGGEPPVPWPEWRARHPAAGTAGNPGAEVDPATD